MENAINRFLNRHGYEISGNASLILQYMLKTTASNSPDDDVVIMFSRALGSSRGLNYFSIGISFMLLGGTSATRQVTFLIELVLEGPCAPLLWRDRTVDRTHFSKIKLSTGRRRRCYLTVWGVTDQSAALPGNINVIIALPRRYFPPRR